MKISIIPFFKLVFIVILFMSIFIITSCKNSKIDSNQMIVKFEQDSINNLANDTLLVSNKLDTLVDSIRVSK